MLGSKDTAQEVTERTWVKLIVVRKISIIPQIPKKKKKKARLFVTYCVDLVQGFYTDHPISVLFSSNYT